jgi:nitrite reductase/ring-hydroxylating ferredoxin subunit
VVTRRSAAAGGGSLTAAGIALCRFEEMKDGESRGFDPYGEGRDFLFVVRRGAALHAWRDSCPHIDGAPLPWRKNAYLNARRDRIVCSAHGALFDIATGRCVLGPCLGQSLQPLTLVVLDGVIYWQPV